jgi:uncharacterized pyridoxal phosphate-containing UPF0001 family protein
MPTLGPRCHYSAEKIYHHRLLKSLREVTDGCKMLENLKKINLKGFVCWTAQAWEQSEHNDQKSNLQKRKNKLII